MAFRYAMSDEFSRAFDPEFNNRLTADMASMALQTAAGRKANQIKLAAWKDLQKSQQGGGGFDIGSGLSMLAGGLNMAKGFGLFGGGGGGGGLGSSFTSKNVQMPDYMGGAGNFSSFFS